MTCIILVFTFLGRKAGDSDLRGKKHSPNLDSFWFPGECVSDLLTSLQEPHFVL
jgi:hypothetical protein